MLGLYPGVGLSPNINPDDVLVRSIVNNPNYTASVAGTNVTTTRATGLLCPFTGASLSNNVPCTRRISLGGKVHDAFGAWPQTVNLFTNSDLGGSALSVAAGCALNTTTNRGPNSLPARGFIEDTNTTAHAMQTQSISGLSNSTQYTVSFYLKSTGRRYARINISSASVSGFSAFCVDLQNGTTGYGTATKLSNSWVKISFQITTSGTVGTPAIFIAGDTDGVPGGATESYLGDGVSGIDIAGIQIVAGAVPLPLARTNGGTTTVNADQHVFTIPTTTQTGAALVAGVPIYWSSPSGGPTPHSDGRYYEDGTDREGITIASNNQVAAYGWAGSKRTILSTLPQQSAGVPRTLTRTWSPTNQEMYKDGVFINNLPGSYTWETRSTVRIGNGKDYTRPFCGLVVVAFCNGFIPSAAAMAAWHRSVVRALQPLSVPIL